LKKVEKSKKVIGGFWKSSKNIAKKKILVGDFFFMD